MKKKIVHENALEYIVSEMTAIFHKDELSQAIVFMNKIAGDPYSCGRLLGTGDQKQYTASIYSRPFSPFRRLVCMYIQRYHRKFEYDPETGASFKASTTRYTQGFVYNIRC